MKTVIITGATRGIGAAAALKFASADYAICAVYRQDDSSARVLIDKLASNGCFATAIKADVSDPEQCRRVVEECARTLGAPCVLVNNAGLSAISPLVDMADDDISSLIDADLKGAIYMTKYAQPHLVDNGGAIVNVSSVWGVVGASCESVYSAAKGGVIAFTKAMAKELAPSGVRVNCVAPGVIDTSMNARFDERERAAITEDIPLGRFGTADEVADAIFWLADGATYVTGQCLGVDGGFGQ